MKPLLVINNKVAGYYTLRKGKVDSTGTPIPGTELVVAAFKNLITDNGMNSIWSCPAGSFGIQHLYPRCFVGSGNTPPAFTDTQLETLVATSIAAEGATTSFVDDVSEPYWKAVKTWRFDAGTATGNLTEVGTGWTSTDLFSRALILDGGGSPTTITVLADEYLDVTFECRNYINITPGTGSITISGTPYDTDYKPAEIATTPSIARAISTNTSPYCHAFETQTLGTVYTKPAGTASQNDGGGLSTYVDGDFYGDVTFEWGLTVGNFTTGIGAMEMFTNQCQFQIAFNPKIPKTNTDILSITFRITWARYP